MNIFLMLSLQHKNSAFKNVHSVKKLIGWPHLVYRLQNVSWISFMMYQVEIVLIVIIHAKHVTESIVSIVWAVIPLIFSMLILRLVNWHALLVILQMRVHESVNCVIKNALLVQLTHKNVQSVLFKKDCSQIIATAH